MTEREKRNELDTSDLLIENEFLVFGAFREDSIDAGYSSTKWLRAVDVHDVEGFSEAYQAFRVLLDGLPATMMDEAL